MKEQLVITFKRNESISLKITCNTDQKEAKRIKLEEKNETDPNPGEIETIPNPGEKIINPLREIRRNPNPGGKVTNSNPVEIEINPNPGEKVINTSSNGETITTHNPGEKTTIDKITGKILTNPNTGEDMYINPRTGEIIANPNPGEKFMDSITGEITTITNPGDNGTNPNPGEKGNDPNAALNLTTSVVFSEASTTKSPALELVYQKVHEVKKHCQVMKEKVKTTNIEKDRWIRYFELVIKNVEKPDLTGFATKHKGWTALHEAACCGYEKILEQLMDETEDKNPQDEKGRTPLHEAAFLGMCSCHRSTNFSI